MKHSVSINRQQEHYEVECSSGRLRRTGYTPAEALKIADEDEPPRESERLADLLEDLGYR